MRTSPIDMRMVAERILNDDSGRVRSCSIPIHCGSNSKLYHYGLFEGNQLVQADKLLILVDSQQAFTAIMDPGTRASVVRSGNLHEFQPTMGPRDIEDHAWKSAYFDRFVDAMVKQGFTDDLGSDYGVYGLPMTHHGKNTVAAWCYPPADPGDLSGRSKIVIKGLVDGGTKEDSFYFDSAQTFESALQKSVEYAATRKEQGRATLDRAAQQSGDVPMPVAVLQRLINLANAQVQVIESSLADGTGQTQKAVDVEEDRQAVEAAERILSNAVESTVRRQETDHDANKIVVVMKDGVVRSVLAQTPKVSLAFIEYAHGLDNEIAVLVPQKNGGFKRATAEVTTAQLAPARVAQLYAIAEKGPSEELDETVADGVFNGQVIRIEDGIVHQKVGRDGSTVKHDASSLSQPVSVGQVVDIKYRHGLGLVGGQSPSTSVER